jgi:thiol-disulfide isomerase/thioredoxin
MILGTYARTIGVWRVGVRAGVTLPYGRIEEDPFALGDMDLPHQHVQLGTGTINPAFAVDAGRNFGDWRATGFVFTQQAFYENSRGYQTGDRYAIGLSLRRALGQRWSLRGGAELQGETAERWNGHVHTDDGNRGRLDAMLAAGATWSDGDRLAVDLGVKVPVYTHVVGGQLRMPAVLEVSASWSFGAAGDEHGDEHDHAHDDHEHEHEHEHAALDIADVETAVAVPGKITIVDYWATWCEPCKVIEPALEHLAEEQPDLIAIRRVDASSWDDYPFDLPHVTIYDAAGTVVFDRSSEGDVDGFLEAIHATVEPPQVAIRATENGFEPANTEVPAGTMVRLVFTRTTDDTCATEILLDVGDSHVEKELPLDTPVTIAVTFSAGTHTYRCGMDMFRGTITAR